MPRAEFKDHAVWITGAGSGIGRAMAVAFAGQGAHVALSGRRLSRLQEVASEIEQSGGRAIAVQCDVTDQKSIRDAVDQVVDAFGGIDVCVANAGFSVTGPFDELEVDDWRRQFDTNVFGLVGTVRAALPFLRKVSGRIALISSVSGMVPTPKTGPYTASKYAVRAIGQTLSIELAGSGVSCTTISPGFVESEIAQVDNQGQFNERRKDRRPKKLMWTAEKAAAVCLKAIRKRKREFVFTNHGKMAAFLGRHAPTALHLAMTRNKGKSDPALGSGGN